MCRLIAQTPHLAKAIHGGPLSGRVRRPMRAADHRAFRTTIRKINDRLAIARFPFLRYGVAILASAAALGITLLIDNPLTEPNTLLVFLGAVMSTS